MGGGGRWQDKSICQGRGEGRLVEGRGREGGWWKGGGEREGRVGGRKGGERKRERVGRREDGREGERTGYPLKQNYFLLLHLYFSFHCFTFLVLDFSFLSPASFFLNFLPAFLLVLFQLTSFRSSFFFSFFLLLFSRFL